MAVRTRNELVRGLREHPAYRKGDNQFISMAEDIADTLSDYEKLKEELKNGSKNT